MLFKTFLTQNYSANVWSSRPEVTKKTNFQLLTATILFLLRTLTYVFFSELIAHFLKFEIQFTTIFIYRAYRAAVATET